jgi:hypothetical protein
MSTNHAGTISHPAGFGGADTVAAAPARQAYQILHIAFVAAPILAGLDKPEHLEEVQQSHQNSCNQPLPSNAVCGLSSADGRHCLQLGERVTGSRRRRPIASLPRCFAGMDIANR